MISRKLLPGLLVTALLAVACPSAPVPAEVPTPAATPPAVAGAPAAPATATPAPTVTSVPIPAEAPTPATPAPEPTVTVAPSRPSTLNVVAHLNLSAGRGNISDLWAHTAASGRSYAYLGTFDEAGCGPDISGVHVVDISKPERPVRARLIPTPGGTLVSDVMVKPLKTRYFSGDLLVFSLETCRSAAGPPEAMGIVLYDVTEPLSPVRLAWNFLDYEVHNVFLYQQGDRAFVVVVRDDAERDFNIIEVTNPSLPVPVVARGAVDWFHPEVAQLAIGAIPIAVFHDVWVQSYPAGHPDAALAGKTIAYLSYWDAGLIMLDITDPSNPVFLGDSNYSDPDPLSGLPPEGNSHAAVPTADGKLVFMGDEDFSPTRTIFTIDTGEFAGDYRSAGNRFTPRIETLPGGVMRGPVTFVGQACDVGDEKVPAPAGVLAPGEIHIALIERGADPCPGAVANVAAAGYGGAIMFIPADLRRRDRVEGAIPLLLVSRRTAQAIMGISPESPPDTPMPSPGRAGNRITARTEFDGWGYARILDVTDPSAIKEVGRFATENVFARPPPPGIHTIHNVIVEGHTAYISWYADGIRVVDFSRPEQPVETGHFVDNVAGSNFWGVYLFKHPNGNSYILGSDMDTGLWILENRGER